MKTSSSFKLAGKTALVTGASKGIGAGIAKHLAAAGAAVVVNYASSKTGADQVVAAITAAGGKAIAVQGDVAKPDDIKRIVAESVMAFGKIDILVNNAGIYEFAPLEGVTPALFHRMFDINVLGLLLTTQEAVKHFPVTGGSVINVSSIASKNALPHTSVYSATKAAVDSITRVLASELGPKKIRVNAVNPGLIVTEGVNSAGLAEGDFRKKMEADTPLGRIGLPDDIAPAVVFLASEDSGWLSGEAISIGGGIR